MNKKTPYMLLVLMSLGMIALRFIRFPVEERMFERAVIQGVRMIGAFGLIILLIQSQVKIRNILIALVGVIQMFMFIYYLSPNMTFQMYCMLDLLKHSLWAASFFLIFQQDREKYYHYIIPIIYLLFGLQSFFFAISINLKITILDYTFWSNVLMIVFVLKMITENRNRTAKS